MTDFMDSFLIFWNAFSGFIQGSIGKIGFILTGKEFGTETTQWVFYISLVLVVIFLAKARREKMRNKIETRQRFDI